MSKKQIGLVAAPFCVLLGGCAERNSNELKTAKAFQVAAEKCLISVRDRNEQFEASSDCRLAENKLDMFISTRDLTKESSVEVQLPIESGYRMVWAARAKSIANDPSLKLWEK